MYKTIEIILGSTVCTFLLRFLSHVKLVANTVESQIAENNAFCGCGCNYSMQPYVTYSPCRSQGQQLLKPTITRNGHVSEIMEIDNPEEKFLSENGTQKAVITRNCSRSVKRTGQCALPKKRRITSLSYYLADLFTTLVDFKWRHILVIYAMSFLLSWFIFGIFWWIIAYAHGDLHDQLSSTNTTSVPCITEMGDFISSFLFSLETQYTTGYGSRSPTTECPEALFLLCVQSIFGVLLQAIMVGAVFAKISRPKARGQTIIFSKRAVICLRDGQLCLMFRIGDVRKSNVVGCKTYAWLLQDRISQEGEFLPNFMSRLTISVDDGGPNLFLLWPVTVVHKITSSSPLYDLTPEDLLHANMEVVASLVCTSETTGQSTEARVSYTARDILWGHRFKPLLQREVANNLIDFQNFDKTKPVCTALCSARQFESWSRSNSQPKNNIINDLEKP